MKYIAVLMLISAFANSEWVDFGTTDINHAHLEVVECTSSGFVVDITLPGFFNSPCTGNGIDFNAIGVPSLTPYAEAEGAPMLPKASFLAAVPDDPDISITVETLVEPVTIPGITPSPMQPIPQDNSYDPV
ncbi:MAG: hypothetical protein JXA64_03860, partial [Candidatus Fermentibacteraceae bacterium]|nr:hypothetical protein [Candidatus Fermentibacteraceae bacterium]